MEPSESSGYFATKVHSLLRNVSQNLPVNDIRKSMPRNTDISMYYRL